jgi:hypothetical protein
MRAFVVDAASKGALRALNYSPAVERIRQAGSSSARPLREIVREFGPAYGTVFTRLDCHPDHGVELITQGDMFAAEPAGRVIRLDSMRQPERHLISRGQVLIAGAGTLGENELYGRSILADGRLIGKYVGPHSMSLHFESPDDDYSLFTYAWLASPTGVQAIRSTSYGTKILGIRKDLLSSLPVPNAPRDVVRHVATLIRQCSENREVYARTIRAARATVSDLPEMREAHEACAERVRRSIMWEGPFPSLGAWNFAGAGGALKLLRRRTSQRLGDYLGPQGMFYGGRSARIPCEPPYGVDFVAQRDAFLIRPIPRRVVLPGVSQHLLFVPEGSLMIAGRGTLGEGEIFGRSVQMTGSLSRLALTEDMLRVTVRDGYSNLLYAFLSTHVGIQLIRTAAVGTKILKLRDDMMRALPVPEVPGDRLASINRLVDQANLARAAADAAETEAIRIIEQEVLPQWLA